MNKKYGDGCMHSLGYNPQPEDFFKRGGYKAADKTGGAFAFVVLSYAENTMYENSTQTESAARQIR